MKKISFYFLFALIVVMAGATAVEKLFGSAFAVEKIYHSWWFIALWSACAIAGLAQICNSCRKQGTICKPAPAMNLPTILVHTAFLLILAGAFTTFLTAKRGYMHLRQNEIHNYFIDEKTQERQPLPFDVKLLLFEVKYHENSDKPANFHSYLLIDGKVREISMNNIHSEQNYRLYQLEYDSDEMGTTLLINYDFWGITITYTGYLLLLISGIWLVFKKIGWLWFAAIGAVTFAVWFYISTLNPMTPILRSPMLALHVSVIMVSYVILLIITVLSAIYLIKARKHKSTNNKSSILQITTKLLYPAVFLLAFGIFLGAVWANISWGRYWGWDSKETWALITLLIYALPIHKRTFKAFSRPKFFCAYCLIAFLSVLMTFLGVSFLLNGLHSYL
ncbi:MAG: cytochrome c biogenesis protein CcsA [Prevotellaceae bacterium]|jgi:ABC-type transport system involved in cytochrome c biogenesis permease subunit|nr:cytochrome c biogenesis protein CcsA [Prevotellaceae bacterium]